MALKREYLRQLIKSSMQCPNFGQYRCVTNSAKNWHEFVRNSSLTEPKKKQSTSVDANKSRCDTKDIRTIPHLPISTLETLRYTNFRHDNSSRTLHNRRNNNVSEIRDAIVTDLMPIDDETRAILLTNASSKVMTKKTDSPEPQAKRFEADLHKYLQTLKSEEKKMFPKPKEQFKKKTKSLDSLSNIVDTKQKRKQMKYAKKKANMESIKKEKDNIKSSKDKKVYIEPAKKEKENTKPAKEKKIYAKSVKKEKENIKPPINVVPEVSRKSARPKTTVSAVQKLYCKKLAALPKFSPKRC